MSACLVETIIVSPLETNCYILADALTGEALIIDAGAEPDAVIRTITVRKWKPSGILNTHGHADHIGGNGALKAAFPGIPLYIHSEDAPYLTEPSLSQAQFIGGPQRSPLADVLLEDGSQIRIGTLTGTVIHTPGHTPGCICLHVADLLFTGDTLFCGTVGRTDLPGGSDETMLRSLEKFKKLPPRTRILPGHGSSCTLGGELLHNPYLSPAQS